jgi:hypothetical protein
VNSSLSRAYFKDSLELKAQFDDWGSQRYEFNTNQTVIDDVLAVRIAGLTETQKFDIEPAFERDKRFYATALIKPFKRTTISLHVEDVQIESRRPTRDLPTDHVTVWANAGDLGSAYPNEYIFPNDTAWIEGGQDIEDDNVFRGGSDNLHVLIGPNPAGTPPWQATTIPSSRPLRRISTRGRIIP